MLMICVLRKDLEYDAVYPRICCTDSVIIHPQLLNFSV